MRTTQMTLEDELVASVDKIAKKTKTTRSAFAREAFREAIRQFQARELEEKHKKGYSSSPVAKDEFSGWQNKQVWGDE